MGFLGKRKTEVPGDSGAFSWLRRARFTSAGAEEGGPVGKKILGWIVIAILVLWALKKPDQVGNLVSQAFTALQTLANHLGS